MSIPIRVLIVEDSEDDSVLIVRELERGGYDPKFERVENRQAMRDALSRLTWDVIVCDYAMPKFSMAEALETLQKSGLNLPFILVSGTVGEEVAVEAMKTGADDYIMKDRLARLVPSIERELREAQKRRQVSVIQEQLKLLSHAVEQSPAVVVITDSKGNIEYVNPKFKDITGYTYKEALGNNPCIMKSGKHTQEFYKGLWATITSGKVWRGEICNKKKGGELYWESASISPVKNKEGTISHFIAVKEEITERKRIDDTIQALVKSTVGTTGQDFFDGVVSSLCEWLGVDCAFMGQIVDGNTVKSLSMQLDGKIINDCNYTLDVIPTPCGNVAESGYCVYPEGVCKLFPNDTVLLEMGAEGYVGTPLQDKNGKVIGLLWAVSRHKLNIPLRTAEVMDIIAAKASTEIERMRADEQIKASLREKEVLLKEIHHRVKNNLQIVSSMLNLQSEYIKEKKTIDVFRESQARIKLIALVHEQLYQAEDLARVDFAEYVRNLINYLLRAYGVNCNCLSTKINGNNVFLDVNTAIPCGLIVNELVSNSLKYAFPACTSGEGKMSKGKIEGKICVSLSPEDDKYTLIVSDNGAGFPEDLDFRNTTTLGMQLVKTLTDQLEGSIKLDVSNGTEFKITF
ncbi:MAG: histidine kinase dimerization/phosphoacceptor domain -containing protein [Candidatus Scalinduaceae bacterium]